MEIKELDIPGCYLITPKIQSDERGSFVKTFHFESFEEFGLELALREEFYSFSRKNVFRGFHFQKPPFAHAKIVYCPKGAVLDYILDVRRNLPTYGKYLEVELNEANGNVLYMPKGIAHGFLSLVDESLMVYKTDCSYDPASDTGVFYGTVGINLPIETSELIVSERDKQLQPFAQFESPFI